MDSQEAREILKLYRPGDNDSADPRMAEALEQARRDPELAAWFAQHRAVCAVIRSRLKAVPIPPGLKQEIIDGRIKQSRVISPPAIGRILAAAAVIVVLALIGWSVFSRSPDGNNLSQYRERMAKSVQRGPNTYMTFVSTNLAEIREYFHTNGAPVDYTLSKSLAQLPGEGGALPYWHTSKVELLCLNAGSDPQGQRNDVWLFITKNNAVPDPPAPGASPQFVKVDDLMTASWTKDGLIYILAGRGGQEDLQKYLE